MRMERRIRHGKRMSSYEEAVMDLMIRVEVVNGIFKDIGTVTMPSSLRKMGKRSIIPPLPLEKRKKKRLYKA